MNIEGNISMQCSIGFAKNSSCHLTTYVSQQGFTDIKEFSAEQQQLLNQRSEVCLAENAQICFHHKALLLDKYAFLQRSCCNPFGVKNHSEKKGLRVVDVETADQLKSTTKHNVKPGQKICPSSRKQVAAKQYIQATSASSQSDDAPESTYRQESLNTSLTAIGVSPLKFQRVSMRDAKSYAKRKISETQEAIIHNIAPAGGFDSTYVQTPSTSKACPDCSDHRQLIKELKEKLHLSKHHEKLQTLILAPQSWTIKEVMQEFGVSERMVKAATKLKAEKGILALSNKKQRKNQ